MISKYTYKGKLPKYKNHSNNFESQKYIDAYDKKFINKVLFDTKFIPLYKVFFRKAEWKSDIEEHEDFSSKTLVYCIEGEGNFYLGNRKYKLLKDRYFIFDSTITHSVELLTKTLTTIVVDLDEKEIKGLKCMKD